MTTPVKLQAIAVAKHIETLLPPLDDIASALLLAESDPGNMGPMVTLPAVYVRIVTSAFEGELLGRKVEALEARIANAKPNANLSDDALLALVIRFATEAEAQTHEPMEGATALWKAAATIAVARMPHDDVLNMMDAVHRLVRAEIVEAIGLGATRQ